MTMSLCARLQLLVSDCILICLCVILVTRILLSKANYLKMYCCSFCGAPLWFLYGLAVNDLCVALHKALRNVWNVPPQTHNKNIALLSDSVPLDISLKARFCKFAKKTICHKKRK